MACIQPGKSKKQAMQYIIPILSKHMLSFFLSFLTKSCKNKAEKRATVSTVPHFVIFDTQMQTFSTHLITPIWISLVSNGHQNLKSQFFLNSPLKTQCIYWLKQVSCSCTKNVLWFKEKWFPEASSQQQFKWIFILKIPEVV